MTWATEHPGQALSMLIPFLFFSFSFKPYKWYLPGPFRILPKHPIFPYSKLQEPVWFSEFVFVLHSPTNITLVTEKYVKWDALLRSPIVMLLILGVNPWVIYFQGHWVAGPLLPHGRATLKVRDEVIGRKECKWGEELEDCRKRGLSSHD